MGLKIVAKSDNSDFFEAFASETRLKIIEMLSVRRMNIKELAEQLEISPAIVTRHIAMMEKIGIVGSENIAGVRGRQKVCYLKENSVKILLNSTNRFKKYETVIPIGAYSETIDLQSPCGIENEKGLIGIVNDPRYFLIPDRYSVNHLWFTNGLLKYNLYDIDIHEISDLQISFLLSLEGHMTDGGQGNVYFGICDYKICEQNFELSNQLQKVKLEFGPNGAFVNGEQHSDVPLSSYITDSECLSIEIGAGYCGGRPTVVNLHTGPNMAGILVKAIVNL